MLEFKKVIPSDSYALGRFFPDLKSKYFFPHPMTEKEAKRICRYQGKDSYYVATENGYVLAYGMLRGWDDGWKIPSLGIAVQPLYRGSGLARSFMYFLHSAAWVNGATKVRLKVFPRNTRAVRLYKSLGYKFERKKENGQLVGFIKL